jgi:hypothetical protein
MPNTPAIATCSAHRLLSQGRSSSDTQAPALSLCPGPMLQGLSYVRVSVVYIRNIMPIRAPAGLFRVQSKPLPGRARILHPPARPDLFLPNVGAQVFCEVELPLYGVLRSSAIIQNQGVGKGLRGSGLGVVTNGAILPLTLVTTARNRDVCESQAG